LVKLAIGTGQYLADNKNSIIFATALLPINGWCKEG
jgi:hypothetical protein